MFKITLSPQFSDQTLKIEKRGSALTINGNSYDFSSLNDCDEIPADAITDQSIIGSITKTNGIVNVTVLMPYSHEDAPERVLFPEPIMLIEDTEIVFNEKVQDDD